MKCLLANPISLHFRASQDSTPDSEAGRKGILTKAGRQRSENSYEVLDRGKYTANYPDNHQGKVLDKRSSGEEFLEN